LLIAGKRDMEIRIGIYSLRGKENKPVEFGMKAM
jgi:hypothetical protein